MTATGTAAAEMAGLEMAGLEMAAAEMAAAEMAGLETRPTVNEFLRVHFVTKIEYATNRRVAYEHSCSARRVGSIR